MKEIFLIVYILVFFCLVIILIGLIFKNGEIHFKLLKLIFPNKLSEVNSYYQLIFTFKFLKLDIKSIFWITFPIYIKSMFKKKYSNEETLKLHNKLIKNNKLIFLFFLIMIFWLFGIGAAFSIN
jgi:hypothetical protein